MKYMETILGAEISKVANMKLLFVIEGIFRVIDIIWKKKGG
jgi:hypothetical protein